MSTTKTPSHDQRAKGASFFTLADLAGTIRLIKGFTDACKTTGVSQEDIDACLRLIDPLTEEIIYLENLSKGGSS